MANLITVPNFIFHQGNAGDDSFEAPIHVCYYRDCISIEQADRSVVVTYEHFKKLFKEIDRFIPEAKHMLDK